MDVMVNIGAVLVIIDIFALLLLFIKSIRRYVGYFLGGSAAYFGLTVFVVSLVVAYQYFGLAVVIFSAITGVGPIFLSIIGYLSHNDLGDLLNYLSYFVPVLVAAPIAAWAIVYEKDKA